MTVQTGVTVERPDKVPLQRPLDTAGLWRAHCPVLACAVLFVLCLGFLWAGGHDEQRILQLLFLFAGGCFLAYRPLAGPSFVLMGREIIFSLGAFFALGVLSSSLALSPRFASYETSSLFLLLLVALGIARGVSRDRSSISALLSLFGLIACAYAFKLLAVYVSVWLVNARPETMDFTPGFSNVRHLNHVQTVGLPLLALVYLLTPKSSGWRRLWMGAAVIWWTILFATGGRGTMLALLVGSVVALALRRRSAFPLMKAMGQAALVGALMYFLFFWMLPTAMGLPPFGEASYIVGRTLNDPVNGRRLLWKCAFDLIQAHPWLGVGPLHFAHYGLSRGDAAHPHNWILQIGSEWGLPALCMLCAALAFAARGLWRTRTRFDALDTENQDMLAAWILIGVAILTDGLVSGNIVMPQSQLVIDFYIACATGWTWSFSPQPAQEAGDTIGSNLMRIVALVALVFLASSVAPDFLDRALNGTVSASSAAGHFGSWWTRLWMDTRF